MGDSFMPDYGADGRIDQATSEALDADVVILFLGTSAINPHTLNTVSTGLKDDHFHSQQCVEHKPILQYHFTAIYLSGMTSDSAIACNSEGACRFAGKLSDASGPHGGGGV